MKNLLLEKMTWPQIKQAMDNGYDTVIITAAAIEQHGPHLEERADEVMGYILAESLGKKLGNALVAPVIRPGLSSHHLAFPGSLTFSVETFQAILKDYIDCYITHGFKNLVFIGSHGGNFEPMQAFIETQDSLHPDVNIIMGLEFEKLKTLLKEIEATDNIPKGALGGHACIFETSILLAGAPECVHMDFAEKGRTEPVTDETIQLLLTEGFAALTANGVLGDPRCASAEKGVRYTEEWVSLMAENINSKLK